MFEFARNKRVFCGAIISWALFFVLAGFTIHFVNNSGSDVDAFRDSFSLTAPIVSGGDFGADADADDIKTALLTTAKWTATPVNFQRSDDAPTEGCPKVNENVHWPTEQIGYTFDGINDDLVVNTEGAPDGTPLGGAVPRCSVAEGDANFESLDSALKEGFPGSSKSDKCKRSWLYGLFGKDQLWKFESDPDWLEKSCKRNYDYEVAIVVLTSLAIIVVGLFAVGSCYIFWTDDDFGSDADQSPFDGYPIPRMVVSGVLLLHFIVIFSLLAASHRSTVSSNGPLMEMTHVSFSGATAVEDMPFRIKLLTGLYPECALTEDGFLQDAQACTNAIDGNGKGFDEDKLREIVTCLDFASKYYENGYICNLPPDYSGYAGKTPHGARLTIDDKRTSSPNAKNLHLTVLDSTLDDSGTWAMLITAWVAVTVIQLVAFLNNAFDFCACCGRNGRRQIIAGGYSGAY